MSTKYEIEKEYPIGIEEIYAILFSETSTFQREYQEKEHHKDIKITEWEKIEEKEEEWKREVSFSMEIDFLPDMLKHKLGLGNVQCKSYHKIKKPRNGKEMTYENHVEIEGFEKDIELSFYQQFDQIGNQQVKGKIVISSNFKRTIWGFTTMISNVIFEKAKSSFKTWEGMVNDYIEVYKKKQSDTPIDITHLINEEKQINEQQHNEQQQQKRRVDIKDDENSPQQDDHHYDEGLFEDAMDIEDSQSETNSSFATTSLLSKSMMEHHHRVPLNVVSNLQESNRKLREKIRKLEKRYVKTTKTLARYKAQPNLESYLEQMDTLWKQNQKLVEKTMTQIKQLILQWFATGFLSGAGLFCIVWFIIKYFTKRKLN
mmetsp:Transcript_3790/g.5610  ORF Transcript_3790/g.5610 Transcript_3790/m.5610 type:complete len:372 (-) Transcript_3790:65-1180(-)